MKRRTAGTVLLTCGLAVLLLLPLVSALGGGIPGGGTASGPTLVGIHGGGFGLHEHGSIDLYDATGHLVWSFAAADSYFDVTMLDDGTVLSGFMRAPTESCGRFEAPCARTGFQVVEPPPAPRVRSEYSFPVRTKLNSEAHDVEPLPSGNFLMTDMEYERILVVSPDGTRLWQWNASRQYDAPADPSTFDWLHINDVDRIAPGRYLVSVRNENQLLIVERDEGVVRVINEDGDPDLFDHQHNPQWLGPGAVLIADSGNDRIVELHYNETAGSWQIAWRLSRADGISFDWPRDADRLPNGNTLITDTVNRRIVEVNESGAVVWSLATKWKPYEADRLPAGEPVGGELYDSPPAESQRLLDGLRTVPLVTEAYRILRVNMPLPYWFSQWHLLGMVAGFVVGLVGGVVRFSASPD